MTLAAVTLAWTVLGPGWNTVQELESKLLTGDNSWDARTPDERMHCQPHCQICDLWLKAENLPRVNQGPAYVTMRVASSIDEEKG
jgi:hypothetical protein